MQPNAKEIAQFIDHTQLKAESTSLQIMALCKEAKQMSFFGVCVNSSWIPLVAKELQGSSVSPVAVVGFPLGAMCTEIKAKEAQWCVAQGAREIDMVLHLGQLKDRNLKYVEDDIRAIVTACGPAKLKVILETALLSKEEKILACELSTKAGAHFVKTSTGFGGGGATLEDIELMRKHSGPKVQIKASGGIKSLEQAMALLRAGADRLGTSSGVAIVQGAIAGDGY